MPDQNPTSAEEVARSSAGRSEAYRLLGALADRVEDLEAERADTHRRLTMLRKALTTIAADESQPLAARHVASVIGRQLAPILQDGERR